MPIVLLVIAAALIVTAYKNTYGNLESALATDIPGFAKWGVSLLVVGGLGYVPGMQTVSRWLLGLVFIVLILRSYQSNKSIFTGFANAFSSASTGAASSQTDPASTVAANPSNPSISTASIQGTTSSGSTASGSTSGSTAASTVSSAINTYNPNSYLTAFMSNAGFGGA
jgi:flagellar biosynthesis component FlhA